MRTLYISDILSRTLYIDKTPKGAKISTCSSLHGGLFLQKIIKSALKYGSE